MNRASLIPLVFLLLVPAAFAQHEMPDDPTPSVSTDPKAPKVATKSNDFETIDSMSIKKTSDSELLITVIVELSGDDDEYEDTLRLKVWADFDEDRVFTDDELILDDSRFADDADDDELTFSGTATLKKGQVLQDSTLIRAVLCYGQTPKSSGSFTFGDVVDQSPPVQVIGSKTVPDLKPGVRRKGAAFQFVESAPGKATGKINWVSPKGTAISLTDTKITVTEGDIELGKPTRSGRTISIPVVGTSTKASIITVKPVLSIKKSAKGGALVLVTNQEEQTVKVANILAPTTIKALGFKVVTRGKGKHMPALRIEEGAAGQEDDEFEVVSPKGTAISLTDTVVKVHKGDIVLGAPYVKGKNRLRIPVLHGSKSRSTVEVLLVLDIGKKARKLIAIKSKYQPRKLFVAYVIK